MARFAGNLTTLGLIVLGLVLVATPLALWVAWTEAILIAVLATGLSAGGLYCLLVRLEKPALPARGQDCGRLRVEPLPDETIDELQGLHPFIHHHRASGGPKFRRAMVHLRRLLYRDPD